MSARSSPSSDQFKEFFEGAGDVWTLPEVSKSTACFATTKRPYQTTSLSALIEALVILLAQYRHSYSVCYRLGFALVHTKRAADRQLTVDFALPVQLVDSAEEDGLGYLFCADMMDFGYVFTDGRYPVVVQDILLADLLYAKLTPNKSNHGRPYDPTAPHAWTNLLADLCDVRAKSTATIKDYYIMVYPLATQYFAPTIGSATQSIALDTEAIVSDMEDIRFLLRAALGDQVDQPWVHRGMARYDNAVLLSCNELMDALASVIDKHWAFRRMHLINLPTCKRLDWSGALSFCMATYSSWMPLDQDTLDDIRQGSGVLRKRTVGAKRTIAAVSPSSVDSPKRSKTTIASIASPIPEAAIDLTTDSSVARPVPENVSPASVTVADADTPASVVSASYTPSSDVYDMHDAIAMDIIGGALEDTTESLAIALRKPVVVTTPIVSAQHDGDDTGVSSASTTPVSTSSASSDDAWMDDVDAFISDLAADEPAQLPSESATTANPNTPQLLSVPESEFEFDSESEVNSDELDSILNDIDVPEPSIDGVASIVDGTQESIASVVDGQHESQESIESIVNVQQEESQELVEPTVPVQCEPQPSNDSLMMSVQQESQTSVEDAAPCSMIASPAASMMLTIPATFPMTQKSLPMSFPQVSSDNALSFSSECIIGVEQSLPLSQAPCSQDAEDNVDELLESQQLPQDLVLEQRLNKLEAQLLGDGQLPHQWYMVEWKDKLDGFIAGMDLFGVTDEADRKQHLYTLPLPEYSPELAPFGRLFYNPFAVPKPTYYDQRGQPMDNDTVHGLLQQHREWFVQYALWWQTTQNSTRVASSTVVVEEPSLLPPLPVLPSAQQTIESSVAADLSGYFADVQHLTQQTMAFAADDQQQQQPQQPQLQISMDGGEQFMPLADDPHLPFYMMEQGGVHLETARRLLRQQVEQLQVDMYRMRNFMAAINISSMNETETYASLSELAHATNTLRPLLQAAVAVASRLPPTVHHIASEFDRANTDMARISVDSPAQRVFAQLCSTGISGQLLATPPAAPRRSRPRSSRGRSRARQEVVNECVLNMVAPANGPGAMSVLAPVQIGH